MKHIVCLCIAIMSASAADLAAANRFFVPPQTLPAGGTQQSLELRYDNDQTVLAYSFGLTYDNTALSVTGVSTTGTLAEAGFVIWTIDAAAGTVALAVLPIFDGSIFMEDRVVPPGVDRSMAFLEVDVLATTDSVTPLTFFSDVLNPTIPISRANVLSDPNGVSITPSLENGTVTIENRTPHISLLNGNTGPAGTAFEVVGEFFEEPGLEVTVCGSVAVAVLRADGVTLDVTAPPCGQVGLAEVKVCTDRGCDVVPDGFDYVAPPGPPTITSLEGNSGQEGTEFVILGTNFQFAFLTVRVCNRAAGIVSVSPDGTMIMARAPNCDALGEATVEVCQELGCVRDTAGFTYEFAGPRFTRGDCDGDSTVNGIVDTVFMLNFLFGGDEQWPCFAACDINDDLGFDVSDAVFLLLSEFGGGAPPPPPTTCGPGAEGSFLFGCETPHC